MSDVADETRHGGLGRQRGGQFGLIGGRPLGEQRQRDRMIAKRLQMRRERGKVGFAHRDRGIDVAAIHDAVLQHQEIGIIR